MANEDPAREGHEPRVRDGTFRDRRNFDGPYRNEGRYISYDQGPYGDPYSKGLYRGNPGPYYKHDEGYDRGPRELRPYYGREDGYDAHVDVDPELFRRMVRAVRQVDGERGKRDDRERKDSAPRVRHYLIGPR